MRVTVIFTFLKLHMSDTLSLNSFLSFPFISSTKSYDLTLIILWIQDTRSTFRSSVIGKDLRLHSMRTNHEIKDEYLLS